MKKITATATLNFLTFIFLLMSVACEKKTDSPPGRDDDDDPDNPISYSFSTPANVRIESISSNGAGLNMLSKTEIVGNYIYSTYPRSVGSHNYPEFLKKTSIGVNNGINTDFEINPGSYYVNNSANSSLFTIDKNGEYMYRINVNEELFNSTKPVVLWQVYKGNLSTGSLAELIPSGDIAQLKFLTKYELKGMRVDDAGNVYIASMANNGCIIKVSASGQITQLASGLINPGFFTVHNEFLYVPISLATDGKIVKIDRNSGNVTNIITNLTGPTNVVIDNHGNLVVRSLFTINGGNYHGYDIYKPTGEHICDITDSNGYSILSDTYENMPMYVDNNNNLYFYHADGVVSGGNTSNNPTGQKGIFKIALIKN